MKHIILFTMLFLCLKIYAGEGNSGGGPRRDMGGNSARKLNPANFQIGSRNGVGMAAEQDIKSKLFHSAIFKSQYPSKVAIKESSIRGIALKNGTYLDGYDLTYTDAARRIDIVQKEGIVHVPTSKNSKWTSIELIDGTMLNQKIDPDRLREALTK